MTPFGFIPDFLEMMNMVSGGFLAREGFAPTLVGGQGTAMAMQQLMSGGDAFVRMTAIDEFAAVAKGALAGVRLDAVPGVQFSRDLGEGQTVASVGGF